MNIVIQYNKKSLVVFVGLVLIIVAILWFSRTASTPQQILQVQPSQIKTTPPPVNDGIDVDVSRVSQTGGGSTFFIALNTHSGDLSTFDAAANVFFRSEGGADAKPKKIGGDRETHHRTIEVTFDSLTFPGILVINNLGSIKERLFELK